MFTPAVNKHMLQEMSQLCGETGMHYTAALKKNLMVYIKKTYLL